MLSAAAALGLPWAAGKDVDGCTSIIVGKGATVDGSVITSHANDCQDCDFRMAYVPARDHAAGSRRKIYDAVWSQYPRVVDLDRSAQYHPGAGISESKVLGDIPQANHTYAIWESTYSLINEKGLGMGESTCSANLVGTATKEPGDGGALFTVGNLMSVALERCETARCAIALMGDLAERHGFYGEDPGRGGAGEAVTIVDQAGEAWVFHVSGGLEERTGAAWAGRRGALWAAQRVPDGHVAVVANNFIIRRVDPEDTENFMTHPGLLELAQEAGLWSGEGEFDFLSVMAPDIRHFQYNPELPPIPMYATLRMWGVFRSAAPSLGVAATDDPYRFPFSVPVDKKVGHGDVMDWLRSHYEGTEFDMTLGALAGPFQSPNRVEGGVGQQRVPGQFARAYSIPRTSYAQVTQSNVKEPATWFAADAAASSVYVPFFSSVLATGGDFESDLYGEGSMKEFSFKSGSTQNAWWAFDFVANWMELSYNNMSKQYVYPKVRQVQNEVIDQAAAAVASGADLAKVSKGIQRRVVDEWWELAGMLVVRYNDGFFNFPESNPQTVGAIGYPPFWLEMIGYSNQNWAPTWVQNSCAVPTMLTEEERTLASPSTGLLELKSHFGPACAAEHANAEALVDAVAPPRGGADAGTALLCMAAVLASSLVSFRAGQRSGRRRAEQEQCGYTKILA